MTLPMVEHFVYRIWDEDGALLYVGCTGDLPQRLRAHRSKSWGDRICRIVAEGPYPKRKALDIESAAIEAERPLHAMSGEQVGRLSSDRRAAAHAASEQCRLSTCRQCNPRPRARSPRSTETATRRLVDRCLNGDLDALVNDLRRAGWAWRPIAVEVTKRSGVDVTHESLRTWFPELREAAVADSA